MARKPVLEGGKRDEIINAAAQLFFTEGFEKTSVRKILERVDGEVGMFYHYFRSKEELFDVVADRFFRGYETEFRKLSEDIHSPEEFADRFLPLYEQSMEQFAHISGNMHWTMTYALHARTVASLVPAAQDLLKRFGYQGPYPMDIASGRIIADLSAAIHSDSFAAMNKEQKKELILRLIRDTLKN